MNEAQLNIDILWICVCSGLVFIMQAGFLCLEIGVTRRKNSINLAIKNLVDFCLSTVVFWLLGFGLMFGATRGGWLGNSGFALDITAKDGYLAAFFLFQLMFCGTAVTIISGAIAERMRIGSYLLISLLVSALIYPVFGHWAWAGRDTGQHYGWLNGAGFVDFAGAAVVHSVGGWVSLAVLLIIGPRLGRYAADGTPLRIHPSNLALSTLGAIFLFVGWLGFNGGSSLAFDDRVPGILINTVLGGSLGALSAGLLGYAVHSRLNVKLFFNGCLGGLVAMTGSCFAVSTPVAALIGLVGGMITVGTESLLKHFRIDDAVGAIPVHLGAGIWGTLAVGLYGDLEILGTGLTRLEQIGVQINGILTCGLWAFGIAFTVLRVLDRAYPLRVPAEHERMGLNLSEHDEQEDYELPSREPGSAASPKPLEP